MALFHIEAQDATKRVLEILAVVFVLFVAAYIGVDVRLWIEVEG